MSATAPEAAYDAIAEWYDASLRNGALLAFADLFTSAVFDRVGDVRGQNVCDLGCGQGKMARQFARRGARSVTGIDLSGKLMAIAWRDEEADPLGIRYVQDDAQALGPVVGEPFDGVLCNFALMDIPDLAATLRSVYRLLRPSGWFVASITHPCFQSPPGRRYDDEGFWRSDNPSGVRGQVGAYHRTLSTYFDALGKVGLTLEGITQPRPPERVAPAILVFQARKKE